MGGDTVQNSKTKTDREGGGHGDTANNQSRVAAWLLSDLSANPAFILQAEN